MVLPALSRQSFEFLTELEDNNNREWFHAHKNQWINDLREPFGEILEAIAATTHGSDVPLKGGRSTMFQINRDVRFSQDKSPYKTNVSGLLSSDGTKKHNSGIAYLHCDAEGGFVAVGSHDLSPQQLGPIRDTILDKPAAFDAVIKGLTSAGRSLETDNQLVSMPRGYAEHAEHRLAPVLRLKSFILRQPLSIDDWLSGDVVDRAGELIRDGEALLTFLRSVPAPD